LSEAIGTKLQPSTVAYPQKHNQII